MTQPQKNAKITKGKSPSASSASSAVKNQNSAVPLDSLKFDPSRTVLYVFEVAAKLRTSKQHIIDLIDEGKLHAVNVAGGKNATHRKFYRIPVESFARFFRENSSLVQAGHPPKPSPKPRGALDREQNRQ